MYILKDDFFNSIFEMYNFFNSVNEYLIYGLFQKVFLGNNQQDFKIKFSITS